MINLGLLVLIILGVVVLIGISIYFNNSNQSSMSMGSVYPTTQQYGGKKRSKLSIVFGILFSVAVILYILSNLDK
jgi:hypothetical protein